MIVVERTLLGACVAKHEARDTTIQFTIEELGGDRLRSLRARMGAPKAITAMAHLLARLIYRGLTRGQTYLENGLAAFAEQNQQNKIQALQRRAAYLGYQLTPATERA